MLHLVFVLIFLLLPSIISSQEKATLTTPVVITRTEYQVAQIHLQRLPIWELRIAVLDNNGNQIIDFHSGVFHSTNNPNGADILIKQLNKANLSVKSLECRALEHLINEGKIISSGCSGVPE